MSRFARSTDGARELLSGEAERLEALSFRISRLFASWGYRLVEPPQLDRAEVYGERAGGPRAPGLAGSADQEHLYRLLDSDGQLLALRPDLTTGVARLAAGLLGDTQVPDCTQAGCADAGAPFAPAADLPLRLRYEGDVFRRSASGSGHARSQRQAGVEIIGSAEPEADAEIIALAYAAARAAGLGEPRLVIGHAGLIHGVIAGLDCADGKQTGSTSRRWLRDALQRRDLVALERAAGPELAGLFAGGPYRPADSAAILGKLADHCRGTEAAAAVDNLLTLERLLAAYGVPQPYLDLALLRDLDYYTGMVFEVLSPAVPSAIAGGGRYDGLLARFGRPLPATGFALSLCTVAPYAVAAQRSAERPRRNLVAWLDRTRDVARGLSLAAALRAEGEIVETMAGARDLSSAVATAAARAVDRLLLVEGGGYREVRLGRGASPASRAAAQAAGLGTGLGIH